MTDFPVPPPLPVAGKNRFTRFARYSWASYVILVGANAIVMMLERQNSLEVPPMIRGLIIVAMAVIGIGAGVRAFFGVGRFGAKGIVWPAIIGITLWMFSLSLALPAMVKRSKLGAAGKDQPQPAQAQARATRPAATHSPTAEQVKDAGLGFAFDLPAGFVALDPAKKPKKYSHAFVHPAPDGVNRMLLVEPMGARLGTKRLRKEEIPAGSPVELLAFNWRGVMIDVIRVPEKMGQVDYVTYNVQVPLKQNGVQFGFGGPASAEAQMKEIVEQVLATLDGEADR